MIIGAPEEAAGGKVSVDRDAFSAPGEPGAGTVYRLAGDVESAASGAHEFRLDPHEVAVWYL